MESSSAGDGAVGKKLGERLRAARRAAGLSLLDVEEISEGEFKASVLGAYERGERNLSVARLLKLARVYGVHATELLPDDAAGGEIVLDLDAAFSLDAEQADLVDGFLVAIQRMRHDSGGPPLTVRRSDLKVLSTLLSEATSVERVGERDDG